jgi:hypothetical protein
VPLHVRHGYLLGSLTFGAVLETIFGTRITRVTLATNEQSAVRVGTAELLPLGQVL